MRVLIVGCGYVGSVLGSRLARSGHEVFGLRRFAVTTPNLTGVKPLRADITNPETLSALPRDYDWVVNCAASGGGTANDYRRLYVQGNANLVNWLQGSKLSRLVYTSSTSVYGQNDGSIVKEDSDAAPEVETGRALVEAEQVLLGAHASSGFPAVVLRVAGIYGPDRGFWLRQFLRNEAQLDGDGTRYLNMIHLEDVAGAIPAALERAPLGEVFNAVDDEPVRQRDMFAWLAERLGKSMPPSQSAGAETARRRGITNKRVSNERLRRELGYEFAYPTFREGFAAELERLK